MKVLQETFGRSETELSNTTILLGPAKWLSGYRSLWPTRSPQDSHSGKKEQISKIYSITLTWAGTYLHKLSH